MSDNKKFKFFKEADEVDPETDVAKIVGTYRRTKNDWISSKGASIYEYNWSKIEKQVSIFKSQQEEADGLFDYIYGECYSNTAEQDGVEINYVKKDSSNMWTPLRETYPDYFIDPRLECKKTENMGRGIFANNDIPKYSFIEAAPVILAYDGILSEVTAIHGKTVLHEYPFKWHNGMMAFSMGWGGIYNHSSRPNVAWRCNEELECLEFITTSEVKKGEQLFIRYLPIWHLENLWFEDEESEKIVENRDTVSAWKEDLSTSTSWKMFRPGLSNFKKK